MVLKKAKNGVRSGSYVNRSIDCNPLNFESGVVFKGNLKPMVFSEDFKPTVTYSLNKRERWLIPKTFRSQLEQLEAQPSRKKTYVLVENPGSTNLPHGRGCSNNFPCEKFCYYSTSNKTPVEITKKKSKRRMGDAANLWKQLDEKTFPPTTEGSALPNGVDRASIFVWHCKKDYTMKKMMTFQVPEKVNAAIRRCNYHCNNKHRKQYHQDWDDFAVVDDSEQVADDISSADEAVDDDADEVIRNEFPPKIDNSLLKLGDLLTFNTGKTEDVTGITEGIEEVVAKSVDIGDGQLACEIFLPFDICASRFRKLAIQDNAAIFFHTEQPATWWLFLDYSTRESAGVDCSVRVVWNRQNARWAKSSATLHYGYTNSDELVDDIRRNIICVDSNRHKQSTAAKVQKTGSSCSKLWKLKGCFFRSFATEEDNGNNNNNNNTDLSLSDCWDLADAPVVGESSQRPCGRARHLKLLGCSHWLRCCSCLKAEMEHGIDAGCTGFVCPSCSDAAADASVTVLEDALLVMVVGVEPFAKFLKKNGKQ